jgi:hypothetical protein
MDMVNKIYISWEEIEELVDELCERIQERLFYTDDMYTSIHGLSRGGLIPAVMISHKLNIRYTDKPQRMTEDEECLIIDDIANSGKTLKEWDGYPTAVLHYKSHTSCCKPTMHAVEQTTDDWIVYPWERAWIPKRNKI